MTVQEVLKSIEKVSKELGNSLSINVDYRGDKDFGLGVGVIKQLAKEIGKDLALADELYATNVHDAKLLATYIDVPESYTQDEIIKRSKQLYPSTFARYFAYNVLAKNQHAVLFIDEWCHGSDEELKIYAYYALQKLAKCKNCLSQAFYFDRLTTISRDIHFVNQEVSEAMLASVHAIGERNDYLKKMSERTLSQINNINHKNLNADRKETLAQSAADVRLPE